MRKLGTKYEWNAVKGSLANLSLGNHEAGMRQGLGHMNCSIAHLGVYNISLSKALIIIIQKERKQ